MRQFSRRERSLAVGASLFALVATPAFAQAPSDLSQNTAPTSVPAGDSIAPAAGNAAPHTGGATEAGTGQGGDIIVTAQRRSEHLRDVPISITALNADTLAKSGVTNTLDLARVATNVEMPQYGGFTRPAIRGIATGLSSLGDTGDTALYIDGVYQPSASGQLADIPDVQSVQILKGPQGSLYGQNAAAGAIIVDTITPSFRLKGFVTASYGNYNDKAVNGYVTGPLSSTIAVALAGSWENRGGFNRDLLRGGHDKGLRSDQIRGKLLWQPTPTVSFTVAAYYSNRKDTGVYTGAPLNGNSVGNANAIYYPGVPFASKPHTFSEDLLPDTRIRDYGISLLGKIGVGDIGTINTVSAYQNVKVFDRTDTDESPIAIGASNPLPISSHDFIQEVNFSSNKFGRFTINAGLFFMSRQEKYNGQLFNYWLNGVPFPYNPGPPAGIIGSYSKNLKQSYAAYIEASYDITDTLSVTAAGRYSYERQKAFNSEYPDPSMYPDPRGYFHFAKFTPRAVLRWKPDNNNMVYASYSQGFKSGLVDNGNIDSCYSTVLMHAYQCLPLAKPVKPEEVDAFEIGYKGRISDTFTFNMAAFHYVYKDIQVFIYNPVLGTGGTQNAATGHIDGVEFDGTLRASHDLTFSMGVSYLKAKYASFKNAEVYVANGLPGLGNSEIVINASGKRLPYAPSWTGNASVDYTHEFSAGVFGLDVNGNYNSAFYFDPNNRVKQHPYALLNAELSFAPSALPGLRLILWGKNLTDHDYLQSVLETPFADAVSWSPPRTFGGRIEYKF
jgi:iron complex outermembrane receptor protein